jgi:hypothetical protein
MMIVSSWSRESDLIKMGVAWRLNHGKLSSVSGFPVYILMQQQTSKILDLLLKVKQQNQWEISSERGSNSILTIQ